MGHDILPRSSYARARSIVSLFVITDMTANTLPGDGVVLQSRILLYEPNVSTPKNALTCLPCVSPRFVCLRPFVDVELRVSASLELSNVQSWSIQ